MRTTERFVATVLSACGSIKEQRIKTGSFAFLLVAIGVAFAFTGTVSSGAAAEDSVDRVIISVLSGSGPCDGSGCSLQFTYSAFCSNAQTGGPINVFIGVPERASAASLRNKTIATILADSNVQALASYCAITFTAKDVFLYGM